jgi:hypothetical protein
LKLILIYAIQFLHFAVGPAADFGNPVEAAADEPDALDLEPEVARAGHRVNGYLRKVIRQSP